MAGAREAAAIERSAFGLLTSYGITLAGARTVSYLHDQRIPASAKRRLRRRLASIVSDGDHLRVHHYVPGIAIAFTSGAVAILRGDGRLNFCLSLVFGTGAGLTLDEFLVLLERPSSYWAHQNVAVAQCAAAGLAGAALAVRFHLHGRRLLDETRPTTADTTTRDRTG